MNRILDIKFTAPPLGGRDDTVFLKEALKREVYYLLDAVGFYLREMLDRESFA